MKKEYPISFYIGLLAFIYAGFLVRGFLAPAMHGIKPWMSIIIFFALPLVYQNLITKGSIGRLAAGVTFFLMFVFFWEVMNIVPMIFVALSLITKGFFQSFAGIDYALPYIKTIAIFITLFIARKSWIGFMSTLFASKRTEVVLESNQANQANQKASLFYNGASGIVSIYQKRKKAPLPRVDYVYEANALLLNSHSRPPVERDSGKHAPVFEFGQTLKVWSKKGSFTFLTEQLPKHWLTIFNRSDEDKDTKKHNKSNDNDEVISF